MIHLAIVCNYIMWLFPDTIVITITEVTEELPMTMTLLMHNLARNTSAKAFPCCNFSFVWNKIVLGAYTILWNILPSFQLNTCLGATLSLVLNFNHAEMTKSAIRIKHTSFDTP